MKEYDKEKLHEYAKELLALCLEKDLNFDYHPVLDLTIIYNRIDGKLNEIGRSLISEDRFNFEYEEYLPIWELIEKVKAL